MHTRAASIVLLGLGLLDVGALNLLLAPRLAGMDVAPPPSLARNDPLAADRTALPAGAVAPLGALDVGGARAGDGGGAAQQGKSASFALRGGRAAPDIAFGSDSALVKGVAVFRALERVRDALARDPGRELLLRGHSDPAGLPGYNADLARRRAAAVKQHLVRHGAPAERIVIEAVGAAEPVDPRPTRAAWARDRRVEVLWR